MTKLDLLEADVRSEFRARWVGWLETYQPGLGGGTGVPDIQIMAKPPLLTPIELKRGEILNGRLFPCEIRPVQVSWHTRFHLAGGRSYFIIGAKPEDHIIFFICSAMDAIAHRSQGMSVGGIYLRNLQTDQRVKKADNLFSASLRTFLNRK